MTKITRKAGIQWRQMGLAAVLPLAISLGCSSTLPSRELTNARWTYNQARNSQVASLAPADLHRAQQALARAERAHRDDPQSFDEVSLSYMAQREAELAMANASQAAAMQRIAQANKLYSSTQNRLRERAQAEAAASATALEQTQSELEQARKQLEGISKVTSEPRGLVITLDGAVLFATGKSELLATAEEKLSRVAELLKQQEPKRRILVEGHTDSVGADAANLRLSEQRAASVRTYLIERGVDPERIVTAGKGEAEPLVSNDSPEGRANNRRVEIVVLP